MSVIYLGQDKYMRADTMQLTKRRPREEFRGTDRIQKGDGQSRRKRLMWARHKSPVSHSRSIDQPHSFLMSALHAATSERSHDFQSNPLVALRGATWAF
jgi:hypothetical protein